MASNDNNLKKMMLYVGPELSELQMANKLVPELIKMGVTPVLGLVQKRKYKNPDSETPAMQELGFYHGEMLQNVVIPYLDEMNQPHLDATGALRMDVCHTPKQLGKHYKVDVEKVHDINSSEHVRRIERDGNIIGAVSLRCTHILQQPIIDTIRAKGFLWNVHPGKMPDIRGVLPVYRALERGDSEIRWSLHSIVDPTIDTGPLHRTTSQKADRSKGSVFLHYNENAEGVSAMVLGALQDVLEGNQLGQMNKLRREGELYTFPTENMTDAFNAAGGTLVEPRTQMLRYYRKTFIAKGSPLRRGFEFVFDDAVRQRFDGGSNVVDKVASFARRVASGSTPTLGGQRAVAAAP